MTGISTCHIACSLSARSAWYKVPGVLGPGALRVLNVRSHFLEGRNMTTGPNAFRTSYVLREKAGRAVAVRSLVR